MKRTLTSLALLAAVLLAAAPARADVVGPPPAVCTTGSDPRTCHGGPYCAPQVCTGNTDCQGGSVCTSVSLCVKLISCASGWTPPDASGPDIQAVTGLCGGGCDGGATCETLKVCMPPDDTTSSSSGGTSNAGCSFDPAGAPGGAGALLGAAVAALLALRRRAQGRDARRHRSV